MQVCWPVEQNPLGKDELVEHNEDLCEIALQSILRYYIHLVEGSRHWPNPMQAKPIASLGSMRRGVQEGTQDLTQWEHYWQIASAGSPCGS